MVFFRICIKYLCSYYYRYIVDVLMLYMKKKTIVKVLYVWLLPSNRTLSLCCILCVLITTVWSPQMVLYTFAPFHTFALLVSSVANVSHHKLTHFCPSFCIMHVQVHCNPILYCSLFVCCIIFFHEKIRNYTENIFSVRSKFSRFSI